MRTLAAGILFLLLIIVAALLAVVLYLSVATFPMAGDMKVPLPAAIGGETSVEVASELAIAPLRLETSLTGHIAVTEDALNAALPSESYSILESNVNSARIASLLGKLAFAKDSLRISFAQGDAVVTSDFTGQFFVRERLPEYAIELPGAGEAVAVQGQIEAAIEKPRLSRDWKAGFAGIRTRVMLDESTIANLRGKFGKQDEFSTLLADLLNSRLAGHAGRFPAIEIDLRARLEPAIAAARDQYGKVALLRQIKKLEAKSVKIDRCPQFEAGRLQMGFAIVISYDPFRDSEQPVQLPAIEFSQVSCPNGWSLQP